MSKINTISIICVLAAFMTGLAVFNFFIINWNSSNTNESKVSGAFHALEFWNLVRAYPGDDIPAEGFTNAFNQAELISFDKSQFTSFIDPWYTIGPHNTGGRTNAITFNPQNPNTIYAGAASGGL